MTMTRRRINQDLISEELEGLDIAQLRKAYRRYKNSTSKFKNKNVRDPLDHVDFEVNLESELAELYQQLVSGNYHPKRPLIHYSPKKYGISRPTVSMQIEDAVVYRFCIEQIDEELIKITRQKNIRGGVMASPTPQPDDGDYYEKWFNDWMEHNASVSKVLGNNKFLATSDISSYFDNVDIDVLTNMLRESIKGKRNLLSLLCFFLEGVKLRYTYATKLKTGLVQDDSDCSRILAYFYLHPHDIRMINFTKKVRGHFFRYVDDMNVVVGNHTDAQLALKTLTDSLRKLGLTASIEKTTIISGEQAIIDMLREENDSIQLLDQKIDERLRSGKQTRRLAAELAELYETFKRAGLEDNKLWLKLLRRFYTLATKLRTDFLFVDLENHLRLYPSLASSGKLTRYFIATQKSTNFSEAVNCVIDYCNSRDNLYPQVETQLMEMLNSIEIEQLSLVAQVKIQDLAQRIVMGSMTRPKEALCEFSRGMAVYLLYRCDPASNVKIAKLYTEGGIQSVYLRKCVAIVSLTCADMPVRKEVMIKLQAETSSEMKRLAFMASNVKELKDHKALKRYRNNTEFYLWGDKWEDSAGVNHDKKITIHYMPTRVRVVRDIIRVNR